MRVFFDLDGTLYQARYSALGAARALFRELGLDAPEERRVIESIGRPLDGFLRNILPETVPPEAVRDRFRYYERREVSGHRLLFPGVTDVLAALRAAGHTLCICSNGTTEYIGLVLSSNGIDGFFDGVYTAREHPSKAAFIKTCLTPGEDAVFVGDSYDDVEAGLFNGIPAVAALYGYGNKDLLGGATFAVSSPAELPSCINRLIVFSHIVEKLIAKGKRVIGISGVDTSGKTVFADSLAEYLRAVGRKCAVIHMDDFHNPMEVRRHGSDELEAYYRHAFNYGQVLDELLQPLKETGYLDKDVLCLNVDTDTYETSRHYSADRDTVVLIEGVLLFRPPVSDYLDGTVFLRIDFDEVLMRARERDVPKYGEAFLLKYINKYIPVQKRYLEEFEPHLRCDVLIDNGDYKSPKIL